MLEVILFYMCALTGFQGQACSTASQAYFVQIGGPQAIDRLNRRYIEPVNHDYIDPLPLEVKSTAGLAYIFYKQKAVINLTKYIKIEASPSNNMLVFKKEF